MKFLKQIAPILLATALLFGITSSVKADNPPPGETVISGDKLVVGNNFVLESGQVLDGSLVVIGGNAEVQTGAVVTGDVAILGGNVDFAGTANGSVNALGGNINLLPGAIVEGDVVTLGGSVSGVDQAQIYGDLETMTGPDRLFSWDGGNALNGALSDRTGALRGMFSDLFGNIFKILAMALLALVVAAILPKPLNNVSQSIQSQPWLSGGTGILTFMAFPLVVLFLTITIVLIPIMLSVVVVFTIACTFGWIAAGKYIGDRLAELFKTTWTDPISAGLGTLVLGTTAWLFSYLFCLGGVLALIVSALGLGGVVLSRFGFSAYGLAAAAQPGSLPPAAAVVEGKLAEPAHPEAGVSDNPENTDADTPLPPQ